MTDYMAKLEKVMCKELEEIAKAGGLTSGTLEKAHLLTDTIKNLYKIECLKENTGADQRESTWETAEKSAESNKLSALDKDTLKQAIEVLMRY